METFGKAVRRLRGAMSLRELSRRAFVDSGHLSRIESGRRPPSLEIASNLDSVLHAGGELVALARTEIDTSVSMRKTGDVRRRTVIASLAGLGGAIVDRAKLGQLLGELAAEHSVTAVVGDWRATAWEYGHRYLVASRDDLIRDLSADLAALRLVMSRASDARSKRGLHEASARLAALLAMACTDIGYLNEARQSWHLARRHGAAAGYRESDLWVRGQEAILGLYSGRAPATLLALADQGLAVAPDATPSAGTVVLLAAKAQTLARLGRAAEAAQTLTQLRFAFDRLPTEVSGCTDSIYGWSERRLRHVASHVHAYVGASADAHRAHDRAVALLPAFASDQRGQIEMHRAARLVRDGHVVDGVQHAAASLAEVPAHRRGRFVLSLASDVLPTIPPSALRRGGRSSRITSSWRQPATQTRPGRGGMPDVRELLIGDRRDGVGHALRADRALRRGARRTRLRGRALRPGSLPDPYQQSAPPFGLHGRLQPHPGLRSARRILVRGATACRRMVDRRRDHPAGGDPRGRQVRRHRADRARDLSPAGPRPGAARPAPGEPP